MSPRQITPVALATPSSSAETTGEARILIDLERVEFIDSSGLRTLLAAAKRADEETYRLRMTHGTGFVADMFRLTALDRTLPFT